MHKLVVVSPGNFAPSGGPEALHQLVCMANIVEPGSAAILYEPENYILSSIEPYQKYNCPVTSFDKIDQNSLIVLPEVWPELAYKFDNKCALWWLSVDFFSSHGQSDLSKIDLHFSQSFYAKKHVEETLGKDCYMLSDWIDFTFSDPIQKKNQICVNPAKGLDLIDSFIERNPSLSVVKIQSMSKDLVMKTMAESKIYIDFGHHPGRDRMPREAALNQCIIFVKDQGAASFYLDVPVDDWFKFKNVSEIEDKIYLSLENSDNFIKQQRSYFEWCRSNYDTFRQEVKNILELI